MEEIARVIYYSRNRMTGPPAEVSAAIHTMLAYIRPANTRAGLTGALMFNQSCFAQVLEGPVEALEATYRRIVKDPRHSDIELLAQGTVPCRTFPLWSMAYVGQSASAAARYRRIAESTGFDPVGMTSDALLHALHTLVQDLDSQPQAP
jgi:hypothetical protein